MNWYTDCNWSNSLFTFLSNKSHSTLDCNILINKVKTFYVIYIRDFQAAGTYENDTI